MGPSPGVVLNDPALIEEVLESPRRMEFEKGNISEQIRPTATDDTVFIAKQSEDWAEKRRAGAHGAAVVRGLAGRPGGADAGGDRRVRGGPARRSRPSTHARAAPADLRRLRGRGGRGEAPDLGVRRLHAAGQGRGRADPGEAPPEVRLAAQGLRGGEDALLRALRRAGPRGARGPEAPTRWT